MMWAKYGSEFVPECAEADLSDAAYRAHTEGIDHLYRVEAKNLMIRKHQLRFIVRSRD